MVKTYTHTHTQSSTITHPSYAIRRFVFSILNECPDAHQPQSVEGLNIPNSTATILLTNITHIYRHTAGDRIRSQWGGCAMLSGLVAEFGARPQSVECTYLNWVLRVQMFNFDYVFITTQQNWKGLVRVGGWGLDCKQTNHFWCRSW